MRRLLLISLAVAIVVVVAGVVTGSGPFTADTLRHVGFTSIEGNYVHSKIEIEPAVTVFGGLDLENSGSRPVDLIEVAIMDKDRSVSFVGAALLRPRENGGSGVLAICARRMPPPGYRTHRLEGATVVPGERVQILLGLDAPAGVGGEVRAVRIIYRIGGREARQVFHHRLQLRPERSTVNCLDRQP